MKLYAAILAEYEAGTTFHISGDNGSVTITDIIEASSDLQRRRCLVTHKLIERMREENHAWRVGYDTHGVPDAENPFTDDEDLAEEWREGRRDWLKDHDAAQTQGNY